MALTDEQIRENSERFIALVNSITRPGINKESLLAKLQKSDFFVAPASSRYHCPYKGGLAEHSLHVYDALVKLVEDLYPDITTTNEDGTTTITHTSPYSEDSIKIVALFHDFSKMGYYNPDVRNEKVYSPTGKKYDEMGKFDWVAKPTFKVKDASERFIFSNHELNSLYMTQTFIPLTVEEASAIANHMGGQGNDSAQNTVSDVFVTYPLACLLHLADMMSTFCIESRVEEG